MTNEEKAKKIYSAVLAEVYGWTAEGDFDENNSLYDTILEIMEE